MVRHVDGERPGGRGREKGGSDGNIVEVGVATRFLGVLIEKMAVGAESGQEGLEGGGFQEEGGHCQGGGGEEEEFDRLGPFGYEDGGGPVWGGA